MGTVTGVEWTNHTQNFWVACQKVSEGCKHCYMFREQTRYGKDPRVVTKTTTWRDPYKWQQEAEAAGVASAAVNSIVRHSSSATSASLVANMRWPSPAA